MCLGLDFSPFLVFGFGRVCFWFLVFFFPPQAGSFLPAVGPPQKFSHMRQSRREAQWAGARDRCFWIPIILTGGRYTRYSHPRASVVSYVKRALLVAVRVKPDNLGNVFAGFWHLVPFVSCWCCFSPFYLNSRRKEGLSFPQKLQQRNIPFYDAPIVTVMGSQVDKLPSCCNQSEPWHFCSNHSNKNCPAFFWQWLRLSWGWLQLFYCNERTQTEEEIVKGEDQLEKMSSKRKQSSMNMISFWIKPYLKAIYHCIQYPLREFSATCNLRILINIGNLYSFLTKNIKIKLKKPFRGQILQYYLIN